MKIGIITFWDSQDNYGQILQSYALCEYLKKEGHESIIIRYTPRRESSNKGLLRKLSLRHLIAYYKFRVEKKNYSNSITRNFDLFRSSYLSYSPKIYHSFKELWMEDWSEYDAFVCGSDQIWSPKSDDQLNAYFLQFAPLGTKRIAYAPSFGRSVLPEDYQQRLHSMLVHFDAVSVREAEGVKFCNDAGIDCEHVCDPTILLNSADYDKFIKKGDRKKKAFCYLIKWDTLFPVEKVRDYVAQHLEGVNYFYTNGQEPIFSSNDSQSIEDWLSAIKKSEIAFTNSFHGVVFSILSHTPFVVFPLIGEAAGMNNRLFSFLGRLGLEHRVYAENIDLVELANTPIDWSIVDKRIKEFRESSIDYLTKALSSEHESNITKRNVCFLTASSIHHIYGGLDRVTELLTGYLTKNGVNVYFVSQRKRPVFHEEYQHFLPNPTELRCEENITWFNHFLESKNIDIVVNQEGNVDITLPINKSIRKVTVLHFNPNYIDDRHFYNKFKDVPLQFFVRLLLKTPLNACGLKFLRKKLKKNYQKQIQWADYFVLLSDRFKRTLLELISEDFDYRKVVAINNPLVIESVNPEIVEQKEKIVLYVGRIDNNFKNVDKLLHIWREISPNIPDWKFVLCGDGPDLNKNKQLIELLEIPNCEMLGQCDPVEYYKQAAVILMASSSSEGWGMVLVEALQYGVVPVVLGSYEAVHDIIHHGTNGLIVDRTEGWEKSFAQKVQGLLSDCSQLQRLQSNTIESIAGFDIDKIGQQWLNFLK